MNFAIFLHICIFYIVGALWAQHLLLFYNDLI